MRGLKILFAILALAVFYSYAPAASVTIYPSDDTYADYYDPSGNYGSMMDLMCGYPAMEQIFIKFSPSDIPPYPINSAVLYFNDIYSFGDPVVSFQACGADWSEYALTYYNMPGASGAVYYANISDAVTGYYAVDITGIVNGWQAGPDYGLVMSADSYDSMYISSRETGLSSGAPYLVIDYNGPTMTPTPTPYIMPIPEAVDNLPLFFVTGGNANWFGQSIYYFAGGDAAQSGDINDSEQSYMETTVSGYAEVSFYWSVSSESGWDYLRFYIDGAMQNEISGSSSWALQTYVLLPGVHTLRWEYSKDYSVSSGFDCGWVDNITFTSAGTPTFTNTRTFTRTATPSITGTPPTATISPTATMVVTYAITPGSGAMWDLAIDPAAFSARYFHSSAAFNGKIWVIGGEDNAGAGLNDVWSSPDGISWSQETAAAGFSPRYGHTSVVFNNRIWVIGGLDPGSGSLNDVWSSPDGINWVQETAAAAFSPRAYHTSVVFNGRMWVIGGMDSMYNSGSDVWSSYDGINWTQETMSAGFAPRFGHSSTVFDNKIWVVNGLDGMNGYNDAWYSDDGITWSQATASAAFSSRYCNTLLQYAGKMWMIGGFDMNSYTFVNDVWSSGDGVTWAMETAAANFSARAAHSGVIFGDKMWVIAGYAYNTVNDVWYSPPGPLNSPTVTPTGTITLTPTPSITGTPPTATVTQTLTLAPTSTVTSIICADAFGRTITTGTPGNFTGFYFANQRYMPQDGTVKALNVYVIDAYGGSIRAAIYSDNAGTPGNLLAQSAQAYPSAAGWLRMIIPDTYLNAGNYWLALQLDGNVGIDVDMGSPDPAVFDSQVFGPFIDPWQSSIALPFSWAVYAEYCPGTPTPAYTVTETPTATETSISSQVPSASATATADESSTVTPTVTETITGTPPTATLTEVLTLTLTLTNTRTPTATPTRTVINTRTGTPTSTFSGTATFTATASLTGTATFTVSGTPTITLTPSPTLTATPTAVMTETVFEIRQPLVYPNPVNPLTGGSFYAGYYLSQDAADAEMKIYTTSFRFIKRIQLSGNDPAGPKVKTIPASELGSFGSGAYYYLIEATGAGSKKARAKANVLLILK